LKAQHEHLHARAITKWLGLPTAFAHAQKSAVSRATCATGWRTRSCSDFGLSGEIVC